MAYTPEYTSRGYLIPALKHGLFQQLRAMILSVNGDVGTLSPKVLSADATAVSSNTLTAQTGLSRDVISGVVYSFRIVLWIAASANEGLQIDLNGGSATLTWLKAMALGYDGSSQALISPVITSLSTAFGPQDAFSGKVEIEGSFLVNAGGTFIPRIAQTAHASGSVQVLKGSSIVVQ